MSAPSPKDRQFRKAKREAQEALAAAEAFLAAPDSPPPFTAEELLPVRQAAQHLKETLAAANPTPLMLQAVSRLDHALSALAENRVAAMRRLLSELTEKP